MQETAAGLWKVWDGIGGEELQTVVVDSLLNELRGEMGKGDVAVVGEARRVRRGEGLKWKRQKHVVL